MILWGVEVWPFPLDCDIAVNTVWTIVHTVMFNVLDGALLKCVVTEVLFSIVGDIDISQGSVATNLRCGHRVSLSATGA